MKHFYNFLKIIKNYFFQKFFQNFIKIYNFKYANLFLKFKKKYILKVCKSTTISVIIFKLNDNVLAALGLSEILFYANESSFARDQMI